MQAEEKIAKIEEYKTWLLAWEKSESAEIRSRINQNTLWIRREVIEAGCFQLMTISPPPAIGGLIMQNIDPFNIMFEPPYNTDIISIVVDMLDQTIGNLRIGSVSSPTNQPEIKMELAAEKGYVFVAMPINSDDPELEDVLDSIKEASKRCGLYAERVDEAQSNERITDRVLESIKKAEYVIADLTNARPNVFYEAGYAQGLGKIPIYIARKGTPLEFDLKDYPIIFFRGMKELKDRLEKRLRGLDKPKRT